MGKEKVAKFKEKIREITRRNRSRRLGETKEEIIAYIRGWGNYYKLAALKDKAIELDGWIRRKLRVIKLKQSKRVYTIACFLRDEGVREDQAFMVAGQGKGGGDYPRQGSPTEPWERSGSGNRGGSLIAERSL